MADLSSEGQASLLSSSLLQSAGTGSSTGTSSGLTSSASFGSFSSPGSGTFQPSSLKRKKTRTVSFSVVAQLFLIVSLVVLVLSISLLFRFLSVVAVDQVASLYFHSVAIEVQLHMRQFDQRSQQWVNWVAQELEQRDYDSPDTLCRDLSSYREYLSAMELVPRSGRGNETSFSFDLLYSTGSPFDERIANFTCSCVLNTTVTDKEEHRPSSSSSCEKLLLEPTDSASAVDTGTQSQAVVQVDTGIQFGSHLINGSVSYTWSLAPTGQSLVYVDAIRTAQVRQPESLTNGDSTTSGGIGSSSGVAIVLVRARVPVGYFRNMLAEVAASPGSSGLSAYLVLSHSPTTPLVAASDDFLSDNEGILSTGPMLFDVGVEGLPSWRIAIEAGTSIVKQLERGPYVVVVISLSITLAVAVVAVLLLRVVLTPLAKLRGDMALAAQLRFTGLPQRHSLIREIEEMMKSFGLMVRMLRSYRPLLLEIAESRTRRGSSRLQSTISVSSDDPEQLDTEDSVNDLRGAAEREEEEEEGETTQDILGGHAARHCIRVTARYISRRKQLEKKRVTFEHIYYDGDQTLLECFITDCLANLERNKFDPVALRIQSSGSYVHVKTKRQLEQAFQTSTGELQVKLQGNATKTLLSPFALFVDLCNLALNMAIIFATVFLVEVTKTEKLSVYIFAALYGFAWAVNVPVALWCLKRGQRHPRFKDWLSQAGLEVSVMLLLCTLNTQHIHFLWSQWSFFGALRFNAPRPLALWKMCVQWSLFGFFFGDIMQLFYKIFRLWNNEPLTGLTGCALGISVLSITLGLPKKISFFALSRQSSDDEMNVDEQSRPRSGLASTLSSEELTLVVLRFPVPRTDKTTKTNQRLCAEFSALYSTAIAQVKQSGGTVLYFHATELVAAFNAPKPVDRHWTKALQCVFGVLSALRPYGIRLFAALTTDRLHVGTLGSTNRKSFQCCAPSTTALLNQMLCAAETYKLPVVATKKFVQCFERRGSVFQEATAPLQQPHRRSPYNWTPIPTFCDEFVYEVTQKADQPKATRRGAAARDSQQRPEAGEQEMALTSRSNMIGPLQRIFGIFGFRCLSSRSVSSSSRMPSASVLSDEERSLVHRLGIFATTWLQAEDEQSALEQLDRPPEGENDGTYRHSLQVQQLDRSGDFSTVGPAGVLQSPSPQGEGDRGEGMQQQHRSWAKVRTAGFVLGNVLRKKRAKPSDVEL